MIAALFVETGGCYFGLPNNMVICRHAAQRPGCPRSILEVLSQRASCVVRPTDARLALRKSWPQRRECAQLAAAESGESCGLAEKVEGRQPGKGSRIPPPMAGSRWIREEREANSAEPQGLAQEIWSDAGILQSHSRFSEWGMRNLSLHAPKDEKCETALCRSLSHFWPRAGSRLLSLQQPFEQCRRFCAGSRSGDQVFGGRS